MACFHQSADDAAGHIASTYECYLWFFQGIFRAVERTTDLIAQYTRRRAPKSLFPCAENIGANSYQRRALGDGGFHVARHTHGERVQLWGEFA